MKAPAQYGRAYLLSETDADDVTYFVHYQFDVIRRALAELESYVSKKTEEIKRVQKLLDESEHFNYRQQALLSHALRHPGFRYSIQSHRTSHGVAYQTARQDLQHLAERGFLDKSQRGKTFIFRSPQDLVDRMEEK